MRHIDYSDKVYTKEILEKTLGKLAVERAEKRLHLEVAQREVKEVEAEINLAEIAYGTRLLREIKGY